MRRTVRAGAAALTLVAALGAMPPASAHPTESFDACLYQPETDTCGDNVSYLYGDLVVLRGTVSPVHPHAQVWRRVPHSSAWEKVGRVDVSDAGDMVWRWHTHRRDAVQDAPYRFRFEIPNHGRSDRVLAFVLFGE